MRYLSVCSGIEAATVAWHPLGWIPAAFSEIEAFPRAVLAHHYPDVPLHGDFTTIKGDEYGPIDLLVGGTPCQSFSVAGLRGGLADDRGNLALQFLKLADRTRARWVVWENVPGVLSSNEGRDFGSILGGLVELGYGFAYRVLDAQFFGVPQRRRRVFVVGHLGDPRRAAAVLFERHSLSGDSAPSREKGQDSAARFGFSTVGSLSGGYGSKLGTDESCQGSVIPAVAHSLRAEGFDASEDGMGRGTPLVPVGVIKGAAIGREPHNGPQYGDTLNDGTCYTLQTNERHAVCFTAKDYGADASDKPVAFKIRSGCEGGGKGYLGSEDKAFTVTASDDQQLFVPANGGVMPAVAFGDATDTLTAGYGRNWNGAQYGMLAPVQSAVRRLTPRECERLQGFPDDYTLIPYRGKPCR